MLSGSGRAVARQDPVRSLLGEREEEEEEEEEEEGRRPVGDVPGVLGGDDEPLRQERTEDGDRAPCLAEELPIGDERG
jgi:hypothetical protein